MNPFDEIAVEEAVRLKEKGVATEVIAVSCGVTQCQETLRTAMAIGADRAILVETRRRTAAAGRGQAAEGAGRQGAAAASSSWASRRSTTTATRPARCWPRWPACRRPPSPARSRWPTARSTVTREVDGGLETVELKLPAVVTTDLRLNEPRYVTLPNIMKAKKKPLDVVKPADLGVDVAPRLKTLKVSEPPKRGAGIKVPDVATLVDKLKNEAKVI